MKIYKVERTDKWNYDEYDSFVCVANSEEEARYMYPSELCRWENKWVYYNAPHESCNYCWTDAPKTLRVYEIKPEDFLSPKVICESFNAG